MDNRLTSTNSVPVRIGLLTIGVFFGGLGGWAALAPLDGAVVGAGTLSVHGNTKTIQHREGGIVSDIVVQDGDLVERNQVLIRLDNTQLRAILDVHLAQLAADRALSARDLAELSNAKQFSFALEPNPDPTLQSVMSREQAIFRNHRFLLQQQLKIVDQRLTETRQQGAGSVAQHDAAMRGLAFGTQQLQSLTTLEHLGLAARNTVLELSRSIETSQGETGQLQSDITRHKAEEAELEAEKLRLIAAAQGDAMHELREAQLRVADMTPRVAADQDLLSRLDIRAPVAGRVVNLQAFTRGGVIEPGKPILEIVPDIRRIVAIAEIRPEDVGHLHTGQIAQVIATGFNARETQPVEGRVDVISADRLVDARTGRTYYTAEISLLSDHVNGKLLRQLGAGMPVEVVVPVEPRTTLDYIIEPLRSSLHSAGREM